MWEYLEALEALAHKQGFQHWVAASTILRGRRLVQQQQEEEGIALMRQGLAAFRATGAELGRAQFLALLVEAYGQIGQTEEGLTLLTEALTAIHKTGERQYEADLYRLKGDLLLAQEGKRQKPVLSPSTSRKINVGAGAKGKRQKSNREPDPRSLTPNPQEEAEACFLKAIEIARKQQAKSLELQAVKRLARLWQQQGKTEAARERLAEIYGWFTEGFETKDLQEAKALLEELT